MVKTCRKGLHRWDNSVNPCCPECDKANKKAWRTKNQETIRAHKAKKHTENREHNNARSTSWYHKNQAGERLKRGGAKWGISPEEYATRVAQPCGICGHIEKVKKMHVDHDHETGRLRGTLCHECNTGLGLFDDSTPRLLSAIQYLSRYA